MRLLGSLAVALYWSDAAERAELAREALQIARRLGDGRRWRSRCAPRSWRRPGPDSTEQGLAWLQELFALTDRCGETVMSLAARSRHVDMLLELDDLAGADTAIETLERLAREARDRRAAAFAPLHRARRAAIEGRLGDAQRMLDEVAAIAGELTASTIPITVASQGVVLTWVQHGLREVVDVVRAYAAGAPAMPVWRAGLAAALADAGRREEALLEFDRLAADDFAALPRDNLWLAAMALLSEAALALDLPEQARALYDKLAPFAGRNVVLPTVGYLGPVQMWLGILARVAGRDVDALEQLRRRRARRRRATARAPRCRGLTSRRLRCSRATAAIAARARAEELLAQRRRRRGRDRHAAARATHRVAARRGSGPRSRRPPRARRPRRRAATLRRVGDVWTITSQGRSIHLNDGRGVRLLALLLERPGVEVHSLDLVAAVDGGAPAGPLLERSGGQETGGRFGVQGGAGPALDAKAKDEYRERVATLEAQLASAEARRDEESAEHARTELAFVRRELSSAVGIGGRDRETGSHCRARADQRHARGPLDAQAHRRLRRALGRRARGRREDRDVLRLPARSAAAARLDRANAAEPRRAVRSAVANGASHVDVRRSCVRHAEKADGRRERSHLPLRRPGRLHVAHRAGGRRRRGRCRRRLPASRASGWPASTAATSSRSSATR